MVPTVTSGISSASLTALMAGWKQSDRLLRLHTPLGPDVLLAETLKGYERISGVRSERGLANAASDADTYDILVMGYPHETRSLIANAVNESAAALQNHHPAISLQYLQTVVIAADYQHALTFCHESAAAF